MTNNKIITQSTDVLIIGAGPVGLFAAFQSHLCQLNCTIIDSLDQIGGQCTELYPEKPIFDIPTIPKCTGQELIEKLKKQLVPFNIPIILRTTIIEIHQITKSKNSEDPEYLNDSPNEHSTKNRRWAAYTSENCIILADYIILATGGGIHKPQKLVISGKEILSRQYIHYSIQDINKFAKQRVAIVGGGDSALDWALTLCESAQVTLIHRREKFTAQPYKITELKKAIKNQYLNFQKGIVKNLSYNEEKQLANIKLSSNSNDCSIEANHLLIFFGKVITPSPIKFFDNKMTFYGNLFCVDPCSLETSIETIFACGDAVHYRNKQKLILSGFHEAALAMRTILKHKENSQQNVLHSSSNQTLINLYKKDQ